MWYGSLNRCQSIPIEGYSLKLVLLLVQKKPAPDARVLKQRDYEEKLHSMQQGLQVRMALQLHFSLPPGAACTGALGCAD